ncbi:hypothetical protein SAMN06272775_0091 [Streptomyces sp. 2323.1]|uniref:helix-turn-helix domain-containing protein n=1 Tax=Streptomyces sp. 2323.1 TaxID=1938841 RepID=UPI000BC0A281|nr:transcriptional regulator [Streptomyces sp. 2323.1]SOE09014.1 hypothetical protein SAMN06272775_0091 [Streptomyces sp. 2323.1]
MNSFLAIDALLAAYTPLPPPAERSRLRRHLGLPADRVAHVLGVDTATLHTWETGQSEPEGQFHAAYSYFLTSVRTTTEVHTQPSAQAASDSEPLTQPAPCFLCGKPATHQVLGYAQHLSASDCAAAAPAPSPEPVSHPVSRDAATERRIPTPRYAAARHSDSLQDPIRDTVAAALDAHDGDPHAATAALTARAIPDAMRLLNASRVGGRYDIVYYPALPEALRKPSPRTADRIWEARLNWQRPQAPGETDPVAVLDINGAYLSALKTHLPLGHLQLTNPQPHDRRRAGIHLVTPPAWERDAYLPNPLGARDEPGPVWITEATLRLLLRLSGRNYELCDPPLIHESYTSGSTESLLEKFRTTLRDARARAIEEGDPVTVEYVKALYAKFISTMGESSYNRELRRPDWMHIIHSQAFANLWSKAYQAHTKGLTLVRVCGTDELHVRGDWRRVFREGRDLSHVKLKNMYEADAVSREPHVVCSDPNIEKRRYEYAGGRYVGCRTCGGDLCTRCYTVHLTPSDLLPERHDDNLCPACQ